MFPESWWVLFIYLFIFDRNSGFISIFIPQLNRNSDIEEESMFLVLQPIWTEFILRGQMSFRKSIAILWPAY